MKTLNWIIVALLAVMILVVGVVKAHAEEPTTHASITFIEGKLEWLAPEGDMPGMNFDFGSIEIPTGETDYTSGVANHQLRIKDARVNNADWELQAKMSTFSDNGGQNTFDGMITLSNPQSDDNDHIEVPESVAIVSDNAAVKVMSMSPAERGIYALTWTGNDVTLSVAEQAAKDVKNVAYKAEITWTLIIG